MNEREYRELVQVIRALFEESGLSDLADLNNYIRSTDAGPHLPESKELVRLMLEAFDRHLAVLDERTVAESLDRIGHHLEDGPTPEAALLHHPTVLSEFSEKETSVEINGYSGISEIRTRLKEFMIDLGREPPTPDRSRGFER